MKQAIAKQWMTSEPAREPCAGERIAGRFVLERRAGSGSAGAVWQARDLESGERVALKLFHPAGPERPDRSAEEARALASVDHPAVVSFVAHGRTREGAPYLAMRWIEGDTLAARLGRTGLTPLESLRLARRLSEGLSALHARGLVHRDLKPSNVMLEGGRVERACIVDLGVSLDRRVPASSDESGAYVGTPRYMAPEQIRTPQRAEPRSDVFALGCILYECLCGVPAFGEIELAAILAQILFEPAPSLRARRPELPAELEGLVAGLLARRPELRPLGRQLDLQLRAATGGLTGLALSRLGVPERVERVGLGGTAASGVFTRGG